MAARSAQRSCNGIRGIPLAFSSDGAYRCSDVLAA
jgi:hypothetical protein